MQAIDLVTPLKTLRETALRSAARLDSGNQYFEGYLAGINHAIELAEIFQLRVDNRLAEAFGEEVA